MATLCETCVNYWREWNTDTCACRHHGFVPNQPKAAGETCRDYEHDERKELTK